MAAVPQSARLFEFFRRLEALPPVATADEAYRQVCDTLNAVEDELSSIPFDPDGPRNDGRMYPPQPDSIRPDHLGRAAVVRYRSKRHNTLIGANGAIEIQHVNGDAIFTKPGRDGRTVGEL